MYYDAKQSMYIPLLIYSSSQSNICAEYAIQLCYQMKVGKNLNTGTKPWILMLQCFPLSWNHHLALVKQN